MRLSRVDTGAAAFALLVLVGGAFGSFEFVHGSERLAIAFCLIPLAIWAMTHPMIPLVLLGLSIPFAIVSLSGASENSTGYKFGIVDVLLALVAVGIILEWTASNPVPLVNALRPVALPVAQYSVLMLLLVSVHHSVHDIVKTGQRFELFLLPMLVGAFAFLKGWHVRALKAYVLASTVLAVIYPFDNLGMQHNPVGQFIGNAVLVLIAVPSVRRLFPCLVILIPGVLLSQSRGAVLATGLGVAIIVALQLSSGRPALRRIFPLILVAVGAFAIAPASLQQRLTTLSSGSQYGAEKPGQYAIYLRQQFAHDAHLIIASHKWTGVGVGNYYNADAQVTATPVLDPHDVLLLQAAEGGYPLEASFILLIVGVLFALRRLRRTEVAPAAAAVLAATVAHGFVDVDLGTWNTCCWPGSW